MTVAVSRAARELQSLVIKGGNTVPVVSIVIRDDRDTHAADRMRYLDGNRCTSEQLWALSCNGKRVSAEQNFLDGE